MTTLFISDLHLDEREPHITEGFIHFLKTQARDVKALYILGDFFEYWVGDDFSSPFTKRIIDALHDVSQHGVATYIMHGNRDFLLGERFCQESGCTLLPDPTRIDLDGTPTLLMHGDTLCLADRAYLRYRRVVRNPFIKKLFLSFPLRLREKIAQKLRRTSDAYTRNRDAMLMDVEPDEVIRVMREHGVNRLIHGHTHRPAIHKLKLEINGKPAERIVLGAWHNMGSVLVCESDGSCQLHDIALNVGATSSG